MIRWSRRSLLERGGALGLALAGAACGKPRPHALACGDTTGLSDTEIQVRTLLNYQDTSNDPNRECDKCLQFSPPDRPGCGACKVLKGPINPRGSCKSFVPKPPI
jgi:hypothetical protein